MKVIYRCEECSLEQIATKMKGRPKKLCDFCKRDRKLARNRKANRAYYWRKKEKGVKLDKRSEKRLT